MLFFVIGIFLAIGATYIYATWDAAKTGGSGQLTESNWNEFVTMIEDNIGGGGGSCYASYSGGCLEGFTNMGSAGSWGHCYGVVNWYGTPYFSSHFRPAGGGCYSGWTSGTIGEAYLCCQQ